MALELVYWLRKTQYKGHVYFDTFPRSVPAHVWRCLISGQNRCWTGQCCGKCYGWRCSILGAPPFSAWSVREMAGVPSLLVRFRRERRDLEWR
eukprot:133130-Rhodomonas_salina.1